MNWKKSVTCVLAAVAIAAAAACTGDGEGGAAKSTKPTQKLSVAMSELKFEPSVLTVEAGRPVQIAVSNKGTAAHDLVIGGMPATGIKNAVGGHGSMLKEGMIMADTHPGDSVQIGFTPTTPGEYEIYCSLAGHKDGGMKGTLRVQ